MENQKTTEKMQVHKHPTYEDNRGSYTPISTTLLEKNWTQCCISVNENPYTFRGLHYQTKSPQTKYVKVVRGKIIDFMVDLETLETDFTIISNDSAVLIPNNKAHGFLTLEPNTLVVYLVDDSYEPNFEKSIVWNKVPKVKEIVESYVRNFDDFIISDKDAIGK